MFDPLLRPVKERVIYPLARLVGERISPIILTIAGMLLGLGAAFAVALNAVGVALVLWLVSRLFDGLDGVVARRQGTQSDFGGYVDLLLDSVVYAAVPLALALRADSVAAYVATLVLLGVFYVNIVSWTVLSTILEKRRAEEARRGAQAQGTAAPNGGHADAPRMTTITMHSGIIEGSETLAFYTLFLIVPGAYVLLSAVMAAATLVTVGQRLVWARRTLAPAGRGAGGAA